MRLATFLPDRPVRGPDGQMAEFGNGRAHRGLALHGHRAFSRAEIASALVPSRDALVEQAPIELAAARGLTRDQLETAVDDAIDYLVTQYDVPIYSTDEAHRAFWRATSHRVKRLRAGRGATVRGQWTRVALDSDHVASTDSDPEAVAIRHSEEDMLREFAATLTPLEELVLRCKYGSQKEKGRKQLAKELHLEIGIVRTAERSIKRKLERFAAILAAGSLCTHREPLLLALWTGKLQEAAEQLALAHLAGCAACRSAHAARLRAVQSGQLPRELANILPIWPGIEVARNRASLRDMLVDWLGRPAAHEGASTGTQVGLAARGAGSAALAKLLATCLGGVALIGGGVYCLQQPLGLDAPRPLPHRALVSPTPTRTPRPKPAATPEHKVVILRATPTATATAKARSKPEPRRTPSPTAHERAQAISPAPAGSAPNGASEFGPVSTSAAHAPAAPAGSGGPEFP